MWPVGLMLAAFFGGAAVTFALTPLVAAYARRLGIVDLPGGRKIHSRPTPRLGGVAVFAGLVFGVVAYSFAFGWDSVLRLLYREDHLSLLVPCTITFVLGVVDDAYGLRPVVRVVIEAMAAIIVMEAGYVIDSLWTPWGAIPLGLLAYPLTLLWFIGVTNSFNLIDGLDGLMSSVGIASLLGIAGVCLSVGMAGTAFLPLALAGALAGFLPWNWHRARVFLGDSGSLLVGFAAAALAIRVSRYASGGVALHVMVALCAIPVFETFLTLARRYVGGQPFFSGDRNHVHHMLVRRGLSVPRAVVALALVQALFAGMAVSSRIGLRWHSLIPISILFGLAVPAIWWLDYPEFRITGRRLMHRLLHPRRRLPPDGAAAQRRDLEMSPDIAEIIRLGASIRKADSPRTLREALNEVVRDWHLSYLALEFSDLGMSIVGRDLPRVQASNREATAYLAGLDGRPCWLFSTEVSEEASGLSSTGSVGVSLSFRLPAEDGRYGRLVCHLEHDRLTSGSVVSDMERCLAEPVAEVLQRLEAAAGRGSQV